MARQLALWTAVLLMIAVVAAAVAPRPQRGTPPVFPAPRAPAAPVGRTVDAVLPARGAVMADVGDVVRLHVNTEVFDRARVEGLSASFPVGPGSAGVLEFVADTPGRYAVRLDISGTRIGVLDIAG
jgi:hypothetical protein